MVETTQLDCQPCCESPPQVTGRLGNCCSCVDAQLPWDLRGQCDRVPQFANDAQTATVLCADGTTVAFTAPENTVFSDSKDTANANALEYAQQQAALKCPTPDGSLTIARITNGYTETSDEVLYAIISWVQDNTAEQACVQYALPDSNSWTTLNCQSVFSGNATFTGVWPVDETQALLFRIRLIRGGDETISNDYEIAP